MTVRLGINGFGRIGRYLMRLLADCDDMPVVVVNARADNAQLAHLFKYDSVHGRFNGTVDHDENGLIINGRHVAVTRCKTGEWVWDRHQVDLVVETSGSVKKREGLAGHLACGAKKVIMSAPVPDADVTIVYGVNNAMYDPARHDVISAASCTTNCLAPAVKALHEAFGIEHGTTTTVHSYTMSQRLLDGSQKDIRRARAAAMSIIPTTTGAAKAVALVIPELKGRLDGTAMRVPTPDGSLVDLVCVVQQPVTAEAVNAKARSRTRWATARSRLSLSTTSETRTAAWWTRSPPASWATDCSRCSSGTTTRPASPISLSALSAWWRTRSGRGSLEPEKILNKNGLRGTAVLRGPQSGGGQSLVIPPAAQPFYLLSAGALDQPLPTSCQVGREGVHNRGTPVPASTETGAGAARYSAPHGCQLEFYQQPRPIATMGRGALLSGVRRQQQHHSQSGKRDHDQTSHGRAPFPACAAPSAGSRVKRSSRALCVIASSFAFRNANDSKCSPAF